MHSPKTRSTSYLALVGGALAVSALVAGCVTSSGAPAPAAPSNPTDTGDNGPAASDSTGTFYLRAWQTQALAPQYTFGLLPQVTISGGVFIDGIVAVPAIYPGPLWVQPSAQTISVAGIQAIVAEARKQGLLDGRTDFIDQAVMGGISAHLELVVDGQKYELTGDPDALTRCRCIPDPGTAPAFAAFWQKLTGLAQWLPDDLGPSAPYEPDRLAVLAMPPTQDASPSTQDTSAMTPKQVPWPLATPFAKFGTAMGNETFRCGVVSGADLASLLPVVKQANQLTRFADSEGTVDSLVVRALVPGEPGPCA
jgi:hypothetical protein